jgi:hypothetical protein
MVDLLVTCICSSFVSGDKGGARERGGAGAIPAARDEPGGAGLPGVPAVGRVRDDAHGGNFAKLIIGARRYAGHRLKSVKPDKGLMSKSLGDPDMGWASFAEDVAVMHRTRTGLPEPTFPSYDLWENPLTPCMCKA